MVHRDFKESAKACETEIHHGGFLIVKDVLRVTECLKRQDQLFFIFSPGSHEFSSKPIYFFVVVRALPGFLRARVKQVPESQGTVSGIKNMPVFWQVFVMKDFRGCERICRSPGKEMD